MSRKYEIWREDEAKYLLELLVEEVKNGQRMENGTFTIEIMTGTVIPSLNARFPYSRKTVDNIRNKLKNWRTILRPIEQVMSIYPRFVWDPVTKLFTASEWVWEAIIKDFPKMDQYRRGKTFENFDDVRLVAGHNSALGRDAAEMIFDEPNALPATETVELEDEEIVEDTDGDEEVIPVPVTILPSPMNHSTSSSHAHVTTSTSTANRKRKTVASELEQSVFEDLIEATTKFRSTLERVVEVLESSHARKTPDWFGTLEKHTDLSKEEKWKAYDIFKDEHLREVFVRMPKGDRAHWIRSRLKNM